MSSPLYLPDEKNGSALKTLASALQSGGKSPLSLRELFLHRRSASLRPDSECGLILCGCTEEEFWSMLPTLRDFSYPVALFCDRRYSKRLLVQLRQIPTVSLHVHASYLQSIPLYDLPIEADPWAVLLDCPMSKELSMLFRTCKTRLLVSCEPSPDLTAAPSSIDLLYARRYTDPPIAPSVRERSVFLPLAETAPFSHPDIAFPLAVLGHQPQTRLALLYGSDWCTEYDKASGDYRVYASFDGLDTQNIPMPREPKEPFVRYLQNGFYLRVGSYLLYGYDAPMQVFCAFSEKRVSILPDALPRLSDTATLYKPNGKEPSCTMAAFRKRLSDYVGDAVTDGSRCALQYMRAVEKASALSAASARAFLEERLLVGKALLYFAEKEKFYLASKDRLSQTIGQKIPKLLQTMRGTASLTEKGSLFLLTEGMRTLLQTEEAAMREFSEQLQQQARLASFRDELLAKRSGKV